MTFLPTVLPAQSDPGQPTFGLDCSTQKEWVAEIRYWVASYSGTDRTPYSSEALVQYYESLEQDKHQHNFLLAFVEAIQADYRGCRNDFGTRHYHASQTWPLVSYLNFITVHPDLLWQDVITFEDVVRDLYLFARELNRNASYEMFIRMSTRIAYRYENYSGREGSLSREFDEDIQDPFLGPIAFWARMQHSSRSRRLTLARHYFSWVLRHACKSHESASASLSALRTAFGLLQGTFPRSPETVSTICAKAFDQVPIGAIDLIRETADSMSIKRPQSNA